MEASPTTPQAIRVVAAAAGQPLGALAASATAAGIAAVGLLHLDRLPLSMCALKLATGCPCPTCGTTRAFGRLFAGDVAGALRMNPLATAGVFLVAVWGLADLVLLPWGRALSISLSAGSTRVARWGALALLLSNWIYLIAAGR
jgi:hypothetical protein